MTKRAFGELEMTVLQILKSGNRMTVKQVHQLIGEETKYNTVMTVMVRLAEKKILGRERIGLQYEYWLISPTKATPSLFEQLKKKLFGIKPSEMFSYLIESNNITDEEFAEMEVLFNKAKQEHANKKTHKSEQEKIKRENQ